MTTSQPADRPRLLWLTERYPPARGGMARSCDRLVRQLRHAGCAIDLIYLRKGRRQHHSPQEGGSLTIWPLGSDVAHSLRALWNEVQLLPTPDLVLAFGGQAPLLVAPPFAAWLGRPLVTLLRGNDFDTGLFDLRWRGPLLEALRSSAQIVAVSAELAGRVRALVPERPVAALHTGIDLEQWRILPSERQQAQAWRAEHSAPGQRVIGLFGELKAKKGGLLLLEALRTSGVAERLHLLIVGQPDDQLQRWLARYGPMISATQLPFCEHYDLLRWYAACDAVALPSLYDGTPNVLAEAAALGLPLLAATTGGMADLLRHGEHGLLFHPGDLHGARAALRAFAAADRQALERWGAACAELARERLSATREAALLLELLGHVR